MSKATSKCTIDSWDEHSYRSGPNGGKLTRANVKLTLSGDIEGHAEVQWLMCYRPDSTADFVGLQHVTGQVGERSGTLVLETRGTFDGQGATGPLRIIPGAGTDELSGVCGYGELGAPHGAQASITLTYRFE
jgi:hypothetical protein